MRILIVSDTHGDIDYFNEVIDREGHFDMVLHCGDGAGDADYFEMKADCPVYAVRGNCDLFSRETNTRIVTVCGKRIYMEHGTRICYFEKTQFDRLAKENNVEVILYGHTHRQRLEKTENTWIINPGSLARPRDGKSGYVVMTVDAEGKIQAEAKQL